MLLSNRDEPLVFFIIAASEGVVAGLGALAVTDAERIQHGPGVADVDLLPFGVLKGSYITE